MRCRAEQTPQEIARAIAGMRVLSQETSMLFADEQIVQVELLGCTPQATVDFIPGYDVVVSFEATQFSLIPDEMRFQYLAAQWLRDSAIMSSTTEMVMLPSYQYIIGMGETAVPFILRRLEDEGAQPNNWFWALRHITGKNPVPPELRGNRRAMAKVWLDWARGRYGW